LREAVAEEMKGRVVGGEGKIAEVDGGYFGGYIKPANLKEKRLDRHAEGLFMAVSPELDGVFMADRDLDKILGDMPNLMKLWFKTNRNMDVEVFHKSLGDTDNDFSFQTITVPAEIAAQALQR
jgi:hypothetical protein